MHHLSLFLSSPLTALHHAGQVVWKEYSLSLRVAPSHFFHLAGAYGLLNPPSRPVHPPRPSSLIVSFSSRHRGIQMTSDDEYGRLSRAIGTLR